MVPIVKTVSLQGINVMPVDVEVHLSSGLPSFQIVGLPDKAVAESRERVRAALTSIGLSLPAKRIVVNLAPADHVKEGSHYDLAIALGLLVAMEVIDYHDVEGYYVLGELALDSSLRAVKGILPVSLQASSENMGVICPEAQGSEALWAGDIPILSPESLLSLVNHFKGTQVLPQPEKQHLEAVPVFADMQDVKGQETAKRALEIAAAGGHNVLMSGPPGSGKSMLAKRMMGILPPMTAKEALETSMIHSVAGLLNGSSLCHTRPFRAPHYSASMAALIGGGAYAKPGEISLAHNGILFVDELPEMSRHVLESLRQPIEDGSVTISRARAHISYPAHFQFLAAMNPCPCGYLAQTDRQCTKAPSCGEKYQAKLSGPMLDRMDIFVHVPHIPVQDLERALPGESSKQILSRVKNARHRQHQDFQKWGVEVHNNAGLQSKDIDKYFVVNPDAKTKLLQSIEKLKMTTRSYYRVLRVAKTISDLADQDSIGVSHILEALSYRNIYSHM